MLPFTSFNSKISDFDTYEASGLAFDGDLGVVGAYNGNIFNTTLHD